VEDITLSDNDGVSLSAAVLYADMRHSTLLVDTKNKEFAAKIYKSFLLSTSMVIRDMGGTITAFDGDRVMAIFTDNLKNTNAVKTDMLIKYLIYKVNSEIPQYYKTDYKIDFGIGIDTSDIFAVRSGIKGYNDIVWLGRASNHAAKYSEIGQNPNNIIISSFVYNNMNDTVKVSNGNNMWTYFSSGLEILYQTNYHWIFY
jgi:class 3 adenylate cyclase